MTNSQHPASPASNAADPSPTAGPGSSAADDRTAGSTAAAARLRELGATYFRTQHTYDPWNASLLGLSEFDHLVGDPRAEAGQLAAAELGAVRRAAEEIDPAILTGTDRVDREVLIALARGAENDAADALWAANASATTYVSRQGLVFQTIPVMSTATPAGEAAYLSRLEGLPGLFAGLGERYREEAARGRFPTRVGVQHAVDELTGYLALPLAEDILLGPALHSGSRDRAAEMVSERIRPAMADLAATLRSDLLPVARPDDRVGIGNIPGGAEAYARATARHTTTDLTPDQIHQIGHQAIAELGGQWQTVGQRALGTSDIPEIFRILRTDPALRFETSAQIVAVAQAALDRAIAASDRYYEGPSIGPCEIVEINAVEAEHGSLAYYRPPSVDGSRPGAHCLLATDPGNRFRFEYEALAFHESVPGHHLQLSSLPSSSTSPSTAGISTWRRAHSTKARACTARCSPRSSGSTTATSTCWAGCRSPPCAPAGWSSTPACTTWAGRGSGRWPSCGTTPRPRSPTSATKSTATSHGPDRRWPTGRRGGRSCASDKTREPASATVSPCLASTAGSWSTGPCRCPSSPATSRTGTRIPPTNQPRSSHGS